MKSVFLNPIEVFAAVAASLWGRALVIVAAVLVGLLSGTLLVRGLNFRWDQVLDPFLWSVVAWLVSPWHLLVVTLTLLGLVSSLRCESRAELCGWAVAIAIAWACLVRFVA